MRVVDFFSLINAGVKRCFAHPLQLLGTDQQVQNAVKALEFGKFETQAVKKSLVHQAPP
jgi:hypothetical protein